MQQETKEKLKNVNAWLRLLYSLFFAIIVFYLVKLLVTLILIVQFCAVLFTTKPVERLRVFSGQLSRYSYQILEYVGYNQQDKPFPFSDWPASQPSVPAAPAKTSAKRKSRRNTAKKVSTAATSTVAEKATESPAYSSANNDQEKTGPDTNE